MSESSITLHHLREATAQAEQWKHGQVEVEMLSYVGGWMGVINLAAVNLHCLACFMMCPAAYYNGRLAGGFCDPDQHYVDVPESLRGCVRIAASLPCEAVGVARRILSGDILADGVFELGRGAGIGQQVLLEGHNRIGDQSTIGDGVKMSRGATVGRGTQIHEAVYMGPDVVVADRVIVGARAVIGRGAQLESDCRVEDDVIVPPGAVVSAGVTVTSATSCRTYSGNIE